MDGELKLLKMAGTSSLASCGRGKNLRRLIPTPVSRVKDHLFSLNKFLLVFQWQIGCQRSLKVCHGWKPSAVIPKLTMSLNFLSCWQWPLAFELRGTIAPWGMQHDFVVVQMKLKTLSILGCGIGTRELQVIYIYLYVCIFTVKSLITLWQAHGWRGLGGWLGANLCYACDSRAPICPGASLRLSMAGSDIWGKALHL